MLWKLSSCCSWSVLRSQLTSCSTAAPLQKCSSGFSLATSSGTICFGSLCVELLRRVRKEFTVELPFLRKKWKWLVCGVLFQYCHGIFTTLAYRLHHPQPQPLYDLGFQLTPELGERNKWVSEIIFGTLFAGLILWTLSPFVLHGQRFYTVVLYSRLLQVLVACQSLRIISFLSTSLPGPNYHCREGRSTAHLGWPSNWWEYVIIDVKRQSTHSCGDLIFSSHTTFVLTFVLAFHEYGQSFPLRCLAWAGAVTLSFLIICSRKHYTVDVVIAWYVVPLVFYTLKRRWTTMRPSVVGDHVEYDVEALTPSDPSTPSAVVLGELQHHGGVTSATTLLSNGISGASSSGSHSPSSVLVELAVASPQFPGGGSEAKPSAQGMAGSSPGSLSRIRSQQTLSSAGGITGAETLPSHLRLPASNHRRNASGNMHHAVSGCQIA